MVSIQREVQDERIIHSMIMLMHTELADNKESRNEEIRKMDSGGTPY